MASKSYTLQVIGSHQEPSELSIKWGKDKPPTMTAHLSIDDPVIKQILERLRMLDSAISRWQQLFADLNKPPKNLTPDDSIANLNIPSADVDRDI